MEKRRNLERGGIGTGQDKKKKSGGTHSLMLNCPGHGKKRRGSLQLVSTQGKRVNIGTHQWNALGNVVLGMAAVMAVREKHEQLGHQEKASK